MSSRCCVLVIVAWLFAVSLTGCGASHGSRAGANGIAGPFTNASFSGAYAFFFSGRDSNGFFAVAGRVSSSGNGTLTGLLDMNASAGLATLPVSGNYNMQPDGRGSATLITTARTFTIHFVIISRQRALIISFDPGTSGHGSMDLQNSATFSTFALSGAHAFNLSGIDSSANPAIAMGGFSSDASGNLTSGLHDISDNGAPSVGQSLTGSYSVVDTTNGRGLLTLNTALGTLHFAFYVVDGQHWKIVESERAPALAGEMFSGQTNLASSGVIGCGPCVFVLSGLDGALNFAATGIYRPGGGTVGPPGFEDINRNGVVSSFTVVSGAYVLAPDFRGLLTVTVGGVTSHYAFYPSSGGQLLLQIDPAHTISGLAFNQTGAGLPFLDLSLEGNYAFSTVGPNVTVAPDEAGELTATVPSQPPGGNITGTTSGTLDIIASGAPSPNVGQNGTFVMDFGGRGSMALTTPFGAQNLILYGTGGAGPVVYMGRDANAVIVGIFEGQQR